MSISIIIIIIVIVIVIIIIIIIIIIMKKLQATIPNKGDDSQRQFLAQHSFAMLEQCCNYSKQCRNNVATLCRAKNRR